MSAKIFVRLRRARNQHRAISVFVYSRLLIFNPIATSQYHHYEGRRNRYRWLQVICCPDGNQRVGRELQFHYRSQWQWKIEYSGRNMLCLRYHKHEHCEGAEYPGNLATMSLRDLAALMFAGLDLQTRPSRRDQSQRNNRLRQP